MSARQYQSGVVYANGVNLHYLDWGGNLPALILLAGWGCNAYIFTRLAPRFGDRFRVLALTRRGHGDSDHPEEGYDLDTLTGDILAFMEALRIQRATLVGHSLAGVELSHIAAKYPERVEGLVYLDAAFEYGAADYRAQMAKNPMRYFAQPELKDGYDTPEDYEAAIRLSFPSLNAIWGPAMHENFLHEIMVNEEGKVVDRMSAATGQAIQRMLDGYSMDSEPIQAPLLSFFCLQDGHYFLAEWMTQEQRSLVLTWFEQDRIPYLRTWMQEFHRRVPQAQVVEIPGGHHYCFLAHEEVVVGAMREFFEA